MSYHVDNEDTIHASTSEIFYVESTKKYCFDLEMYRAKVEQKYFFNAAYAYDSEKKNI